MFSDVIRDDVVTLESIGPVKVSLIECRGSEPVRPWRYLECALLWEPTADGEHESACYIMDSNVSPEHRVAALALYEALVQPENLARTMHFILTSRPAEEWRY